MSAKSIALVLASLPMVVHAVAETALAQAGHGDAAAAQRAVDVARATTIPDCTVHVDAASRGGDGSPDRPLASISGAVAAAAPGGVVCVAEGDYREQVTPGTKALIFAGGFKSGSGFRIRDSAKFVSRAIGQGGSFIKYVDPAPGNGSLTVVDGFDISGYAQAVVRDFYESQRFDVTNNFIHDNDCASNELAGGAFALVNVSGSVRGNVIRNNVCGRGGGGFLNDTLNQNKVIIEGNWIDANHGVEPDSAHGGGLYLFGNTLTIVANRFTGNTVTQWGGGLYVGAYTAGNQPTTAFLSHNVYKANRAGNSGGGFFCDDGANCTSRHEIYDGNCGGNVLVDGGSEGSAATIGIFDHVTSVNARSPDCSAAGAGFFLNTYEPFASDSYSISNSIFWANGEGQDIVVACGQRCSLPRLSVERSMLQTRYGDGSIKVAFKSGVRPPVDPGFAAPDAGDFRLSAASPLRGMAADGGDLGARQSSPSDPASAVAPPAADTSVPTAPATSGSGGDRRQMPRDGTRTATRIDELPAKEAFETAKELNTIAGWDAFLKRYPDGFWANMARAYIKTLRADR